jgi:CSLREA domain-containing protein
VLILAVAMSYSLPAAVLLGATPAHATAPIVVNSANDPGDGTCNVAGCTLAEAIQLANSTPGIDTIHFAIGRGARVIHAPNGLPLVNDPVVIDATTQPGYAGTPLIEVTPGSGSGLASWAFYVYSGGATIEGFDINGYERQIRLEHGGNNVIRANYLGVDPSGTTAGFQRG